MNALEVLVSVLAAVGTLDLLAWRWGADSREGREWEWRPSESARGPQPARPPTGLHPGRSRG